MYKYTIRRVFRLLLMTGLCLGTLVSIGAVGEADSPEPPVVAPVVVDDPASPAAEPVVPEHKPKKPVLSAKEIQQRRIAALLRKMDLDEQQQQALAVRLGEDAGLLQRLKQGGLSQADLVYLALPNGRSDRLERYGDWAAEHPEDTAETVVLQVNMDQDQEFFSLIWEIADPSSPAVLVNKHHILPAEYVPELEALGRGYGSGSMQPEAAAAFRTMADAARSDGVSLRSVSAYRSYALQRSAYYNYAGMYGQAVADDFSARPGHSEHQTGLALDINVASSLAHFENTYTFAWLVEHCAEYGFILRYNQGQEAVTGYRFEPWHYRYVGKEAAAVIMERGITYEEYVALQPVWGTYSYHS